MSPISVLVTLCAYLAVLFSLAYLSGRRADNAGFFIGNRRTPWYMATLAMIGAAMSGVTFISVPGSVAADSFSYMQMVVGFTVGQLIVAFVLVPVFYRHGVMSLYQYLDTRFGITTHRTGAWCFFVSKAIGASLKIYVVCAVMQMLVFDHFNLPFIVNILFTMFIVWLYTRWGGVRSLIPTDTLQSLCLVASVTVCIWAVCRGLGFSAREACEAVAASPYSRMWFFDDPSSARYFWKMAAGGALCLVAMTGLDQDMMQRNLSCRTMRGSQTNIVLTALCQIFVILLLLALGALLYIYMARTGMPVPEKGDRAFALVATDGAMPAIAGIAFVVGLVSCTYSATGSALTAITTSFTLDIMHAASHDETRLARLRKRVHVAMAAVMTAVILIFEHFGSDSVINVVFKVAGYTYGPILGLFVFGLACRRRIRERFVPLIAVASPAAGWLLQRFAAENFGYHIGFELLGYNALFCISGLVLISYPHNETSA